MFSRDVIYQCPNKNLSSSRGANTASTHSSSLLQYINIIQRLLKLKVESVGFFPAVPKRTTKTADCWVSLPGRQINTCWVVKASQAATKWENKEIQAEGSRVSADTTLTRLYSHSSLSLCLFLSSHVFGSSHYICCVRCALMRLKSVLRCWKDDVQ